MEKPQIITRAMVRGMSAFLAEYDELRKSITSLSKSKSNVGLKVFRSNSSYYSTPLVRITPAALLDVMKQRLQTLESKMEVYNLQV